MLKVIKLTMIWVVAISLAAGCGGTTTPEALDAASSLAAAEVHAPAGLENEPAAANLNAHSSTLAVNPSPTPTMVPEASRPVEGWAVLVVKEDYRDVGMSDLTTGFINLYQIRALLGYSGWRDDHILELRDDFGRGELREALVWLASNTDQNDVALLYILGHGSFLSDHLDWDGFFAEDWASVDSERRVLIVEACEAGAFTAEIKGDPGPYLSVAAVDADEFGWVGLWEEGLPVIGGVFSHYFVAAFSDPTVDTDEDGTVSVQEAALSAEGKQRAYLQDVVLAVPEFLEMYHELGALPEEDPDFPDVILDDALEEPLYLALDAYLENE